MTVEKNESAAESTDAKLPVITAVLSMLHEPSTRTNSATRRFRSEPVLAWTLHRLGQSKRIRDVAILCWDDQASAVEPIAAEMGASVFPRPGRGSVQQIEAISASRRWADGWRGGLLAACEFDRGFYAPWAMEIIQSTGAQMLAIADPSAALIDPALIDALAAHADRHNQLEFYFSQAAPGLGAALMRTSLLKQLAEMKSHPGTLLSYRPDCPLRDPISSESCMPVEAPLARTTHRFTLDSDRQIERISSATIHLNGKLMKSESQTLLHSMQRAPMADALPREIVLELTTRRASRAIFRSASPIDRSDLSVAQAKKIFAEFSQADDARLTLAGAGDPLLSAHFLEIIEAARDAGFNAIAIETDLLEITPAILERLAAASVDVVSVHLPGATAGVYRQVMGVDGFSSALYGVRDLVQHRQNLGRGNPLIVPTFVKCAVNLAEMEQWYDHWQRVLGCAVISGPGDFCGAIADVSAADMTPPRRVPCRRIANRLTILCNGKIVPCEQDLFGAHALGTIETISISEAWRKMNDLRARFMPMGIGNNIRCVASVAIGIGHKNYQIRFQEQFVKMNVLGVILARAGSAGLPQKHLLPLCGRPVIEYSFDHALAARTLSRIVVSTDCAGVARLAALRHLPVIDRLADLATADASVQDVMLHAMRRAEEQYAFSADALVVIYGNVPVRGEGVIDRAVALLKSSGCDSVRSFCPVGKWHPAWMSRLAGDRVEALQPGSIHRRQDLAALYLHDGAVVAVSRKSMLRGIETPADPHAFFGIDRRGIHTEVGETVEVDHRRDLYWAEAVLRDQLALTARVA